MVEEAQTNVWKGGDIQDSTEIDSEDFYVKGH